MITWKVSFINMNLKFLLEKKLVLKVFQTQVVSIYFQSTKTVSTALSDFHKLVLTVLETSIVKNKPREIQHRNYKYFDPRKINRDLKEEFSH